MNTTALAATLARLGLRILPEDYESTVGHMRDMLAWDARRDTPIPPEKLFIHQRARDIVAAADTPLGEAPIASPTAPANVVSFPNAAPAPELPPFDESTAVLGISDSGAAVTVAGMRAGGIYQTWERIKTLTALGVSVRRFAIEGGLGDPWVRRLAQERGIDVPAVHAAARASGIDPDRALQAEVEIHEQAERDMEQSGFVVAPRRTPSARQEEDRAVAELAARKGLDPISAKVCDGELRRIARSRAG